jgi:hypothetical protein
MICGRHLTCIGEKRRAYKHLVENPKGTIPLGRHTPRLKNNIEVDLEEYNGWEWTGIA